MLLSFFGERAAAYEQPQYDVIKVYEDFELRRYAPYLVAETVVSGNFDEVGNKAFEILAGYISGNNQKNTKMAMTAPVNQSPVTQSGEKIAMTIPVIQTLGYGRVTPGDCSPEVPTDPDGTW